MGHEAQRRMMASKILLIGCGSGLGVETAKNCVLAGVNELVLVDDDEPTSYDLGGNFYLQESHLLGASQSTRAQLCVEPLSELNPYVTVRVEQQQNDDDNDDAWLLSLIPGMTCVCVTIPMSDSFLFQMNQKCRSCNTAFIYALSNSVFGRIFCDFGTNHVITDTDGNPPVVSQVESIILCETNQTESNDSSAAAAALVVVVKVLEDQGRHGLETGDFVQFSRLSNNHAGGSSQSLLLQEKTTNYQVKVTGPYTFELVDVDLSSSSLENGAVVATQGYITQVKRPKTMSFDTYEQALSSPGDMLMSDFAKFDRPPLLHLAYKALLQYKEQQGDFPTPGNVMQATRVYELAKSLDTTTKDGGLLQDDEDGKKKRIILHLASGAKAQLSPMCAALGGMVGQEVLKACSGKFTPIKGFFYLDADECLPDDLLSEELVAPTNTRYDSQIAVFGRDMQQRINDLSYFIVGAGAIGCEMLKNWALMGVGCGEGAGHVTVTDMDRIEKSNLSRQFLFRNSDINSFKSTTAAKAVQVMNPNMNITALQEKVAPETEHIFGDDFYDKLSGVCTALDNVEARLYVDQRCLFYRLPMLESGTLGTKGNTQVVVPHVTEHYGATRDPPEKSIPVCTLKNFPNQIQHTLQWARDYFEGIFKQSAEEVNSYLSHTPEAYLESLQPNTKLETLKMLQRTLVNDRPVTFEDCVVWARLKFEELFNNQIRQLLHNFPPDQVTSSGQPFWSGSKRCPKPLTFDLEDTCEDAGMRNHFDFVVAAANLRASLYGIKGRTDEEYFREVLKNIIVPDFAPEEGVKIAENDAEEEKNNNDDPMDGAGTEAEEIWNSLPKPSALAGFKLNPIDFDKDIDDHMLFVTACSNLRALNYSIPTEDTHRSRAIAG
jgi:ubiquitin-activating enzyme E1